MQKMKGLLIWIVGGAVMAGASVAGAASVDLPGSALNGNAVIDNSGAGRASISATLINTAPIELSIVLSAAELLAGTVAFNGDFLVAAGALPGYRVEIVSPGVSIGTVGDVVDSFGSFLAASGGATVQDVDFVPDENLFFEIGDPLSTGVQTNWAFHVSGLAPGTDRFNVRFSVVPEPGTALLMGLGLAGLARGGRARRV